MRTNEPDKTTGMQPLPFLDTLPWALSHASEEVAIPAAVVPKCGTIGEAIPDTTTCDTFQLFIRE